MLGVWTGQDLSSRTTVSGIVVENRIQELWVRGRYRAGKSFPAGLPIGQLADGRERRQSVQSFGKNKKKSEYVTRHLANPRGIVARYRAVMSNRGMPVWDTELNVSRIRIWNVGSGRHPSVTLLVQGYMNSTGWGRPAGDLEK